MVRSDIFLKKPKETAVKCDKYSYSLLLIEDTIFKYNMAINS